MPAITIFSAPKPFTNPHIALIQRNAIQSWIHLAQDAQADNVQVILVGQESGLAEAAQEFGVTHLPDVRRNAQGTPLVSSIFDLARQGGQSQLMCYLNADMLLTPDFLQHCRQVGEQTERFLLIGQRWDLDVTQPMDFSAGWEERLRDEVHQRGRLHKPAGSDYFVFPRSIFTGIPDFSIGRAGWDNWMIYHARQQGWQVIDGTPSIFVVHQSHDYSHLPGGKPHYNLEESQANMRLAGGLAHMYMVLDASYQLRDGRIQPAAFTPLRGLRLVERWLMPEDGRLRGFRGSLARAARRTRRRFTES